MNNDEMRTLLINPRPIALGDTVYPFGIDAFIWRRLDRVGIYGQTFGIVQAEARGTDGRIYILNPKRLRIAAANEVTIAVPMPTMFEKRLALLEIFSEWCTENSVEKSPETFLAFLYAEDLIDARKAYDVIRSREAQRC